MRDDSTTRPTCAHCGVEYAPSIPPRPGRKYCSTGCKEDARHARRYTPRPRPDRSAQAETMPDGSVRFPLTRGQWAVVDAADAPAALAFRWQAVPSPNTWYARRESWLGDGKSKGVLLHRAILGAPEGVEVDHKDGDGLNNRRSNLRLATHKQNMGNMRKHRNNTSGYTGVSRHPRDRGRWRAVIMVDGKQRYLGVFRDKESAAEAYAEAARRILGEWAPRELEGLV